MININLSTLTIRKNVLSIINTINQILKILYTFVKSFLRTIILSINILLIGKQTTRSSFNRARFIKTIINRNIYSNKKVRLDGRVILS